MLPKEAAEWPMIKLDVTSDSGKPLYHDRITGGFEQVDWIGTYKGLPDYGLWSCLPFKQFVFGITLNKTEDGDTVYRSASVELLENFHEHDKVWYNVLKMSSDSYESSVLLLIHQGCLFDLSDSPLPDQDLWVLANAVQILLLNLHSGCEAKLCRITDKQKAINKKRLAKGKKPLYEETLIKIKPSVYYKPTGAKRYTPTCAHQRRGHFRTLSSGKKVWVRDCKVSEGHERSVKQTYVFEYEQYS